MPHATNYPEPNGKQNHGRVGTSRPDNRFDSPASVGAYNLRVVTNTCRRQSRCRRIANIIRIFAVIDECRVNLYHVTMKRTISFSILESTFHPFRLYAYRSMGVGRKKLKYERVYSRTLIFNGI